MPLRSERAFTVCVIFLKSRFRALLLVSDSRLDYPLDGVVPFDFWWGHSLSFPVSSSLLIYLIFLVCPGQIFTVGFLVLCGWSVVGSIPEGLVVTPLSPGG